MKRDAARTIALLNAYSYTTIADQAKQQRKCTVFRASWDARARAPWDTRRVRVTAHTTPMACKGWLANEEETNRLLGRCVPRGP